MQSAFLRALQAVQTVDGSAMGTLPLTALMPVTILLEGLILGTVEAVNRCTVRHHVGSVTRWEHSACGFWSLQTSPYLSCNFTLLISRNS